MLGIDELLQAVKGKRVGAILNPTSVTPQLRHLADVLHEEGSLAALFGSFMVSYTTAKAEAMGVEPPRGSMRRAERAIYLLVAAGLTPYSRFLFAGTPSHALRELPMVFALILVALVIDDVEEAQLVHAL